MSPAFTDGERARLGEAFDAVVPGSADLGAVDYVEQLLGALDHDPPRIWAGPDGWLALGPWERHAWAQRLDDWRHAYRRVLDGRATAADARVLHVHACEATYGDPAYGGNRAAAGWQLIAFPEPLFPPARTS